ncbi:MAG: hypothetical protein RLZZ574_2341, partial [Cyanobacteriota bacterium]
LDGELIGLTPIEVKCIPQGLTVFTPVDQVRQVQERLDHLPGIKITAKKSAEEQKPKPLKSIITTIKDGVKIDSEEFLKGEG